MNMCEYVWHVGGEVCTHDCPGCIKYDVRVCVCCGEEFPVSQLVEIDGMHFCSSECAEFWHGDGEETA